MDIEETMRQRDGLTHRKIEIEDIKTREEDNIKARAPYHRTSKSDEGLPKKPPTSAPMKVIPPIPEDRSIGWAAAKWPQSALLSQSEKQTQ